MQALQNECNRDVKIVKRVDILCKVAIGKRIHICLSLYCYILS